MIVVFDEYGVVHAVYNQLEVRQVYERHRRIENWQIRTLCSKAEWLDSLRGVNEQADLDLGERGNIVTCIRCAAIECDHGVGFDSAKAKSFKMTSSEIRTRWPRLEGTCKKGCGYHGIYYASYEHYVYGDW